MGEAGGRVVVVVCLAAEPWRDCASSVVANTNGAVDAVTRPSAGIHGTGNLALL